MTTDPSTETATRSALTQRKTVIYDDHGTLVRLDFDQVGWRGQSGRLYVLGDDPSLTERGGFSPVWQISHSDLVADLVPDGAEVVRDV